MGLLVSFDGHGGDGHGGDVGAMGGWWGGVASSGRGAGPVREDDCELVGGRGIVWWERGGEN